MAITFYPSYAYDAMVRERFQDIRFFTNRTGMSGPQDPQDGMENGQRIETFCTARVEGYSTIVAPARRKLSLCTIGAFSSCASTLPPQTRIGRFCSIAPNVSVMGWRHPVDAVTHSSVAFNRHREFTVTYLEDYRHARGLEPEWRSVPTPQGREDVRIGNDVWIASDVTLAPGITIGDGAVVAANSVVVKDVAPYTIVGGNPAKPIRDRFPREIIDEMLAQKWWRYEYGAMLESRLDFAKPAAFLKQLSDLDLPLASYSSISGVTLEPDVPLAERILFTVHGTMMRWNGRQFWHDDRAQETGFALRRNSRLPDGARMIDNEDGSVSIGFGDKFLSPRDNGHSVVLEARKQAWERFLLV